MLPAKDQESPTSPCFSYECTAVKGGEQIAGERKCVLVVADSLLYAAPKARRMPPDAAPGAFLTVTSGPIVNNEEASFGPSLGAAPDDSKERIFHSCHEESAHGVTGFPRLLIRLPSE